MLETAAHLSQSLKSEGKWLWRQLEYMRLSCCQAISHCSGSVNGEMRTASNVSFFLSFFLSFHSGSSSYLMIRQSSWSGCGGGFHARNWMRRSLPTVGWLEAAAIVKAFQKPAQFRHSLLLEFIIDNHFFRMKGMNPSNVHLFTGGGCCCGRKQFLIALGDLRAVKTLVTRY